MPTTDVNITSSVQLVGYILLLLCGDIIPCPGPLNLNDFAKLHCTNILHGNVSILQSNVVHISSLLYLYPDIDILGLTETDSTGDPEDALVQSLLQIPGFTFLNPNHLTGKGGELVCTFPIKCVLIEEMTWNMDDIECIWIEVTCKFAKHFHVCCMYRLLSSSHYLPNNW